MKPIDFHDYLARTRDRRDILADWRWLIGDQLLLWHATKFADAFLKDADGALYFLNALDGEVAKVASSESECVAQLSTPESLDHWFLAGLVDGAARRGMIPGEEECLMYQISPLIGGKISLDNVVVFPLFVALSMSGQLHRQLAGRSPESQITEFRFDENERPPGLGIPGW